MNKKLLVVGAVVAVLLGALAVAGLVLPASDVSTVVGPKGDKGAQGDRGAQGAQGLRGLTGLQGPKGEPSDTTLGGLNADNFVPHLSINQVTQVFASQQFRQATSTACAIPSPSASSTLASHTFNFTEGTSTHVGVDIFRTANRTTFATTSGTRIGSTYVFHEESNEVGLGILGIHASTSVTGDAGLELATYFPPNTQLVDALYTNSMERATSADSDQSFSLTGDCKTIFQVF